MKHLKPQTRGARTEGTDAARIQSQYANCLLNSLPTPALSERLSLSLCEGYRHLTVLKVRCTHAGLSSDTSSERLSESLMRTREAEAMHAVWDVLHRYLVALQLRELQRCPLDAGLEAGALVAERCVEALTDNIGLSAELGGE